MEAMAIKFEALKAKLRAEIAAEMELERKASAYP